MSSEGGWGPPTGTSGWGPPPGPGSGGPPRTETKAVVALVLAVLAYTPTIPFIGAVVALFVARAARRDIEASGGQLTGLSMCTWAVVLSWVHLAFIVLIVLGGLALFVLPLGLSL